MKYSKEGQTFKAKANTFTLINYTKANDVHLENVNPGHSKFYQKKVSSEYSACMYKYMRLALAALF
jgi:hypothetical protein